MNKQESDKEPTTMEGKATMELTREQFDILAELSESKTVLLQRHSGQAGGYNINTIDTTMNALQALGYVADGAITHRGLSALEPYRVKRAVFIAAGFGTRMVPITFNTPKPLVRVHGIRIIDRLIDACLKAGINEIYIVRGYLAELFDQLLYKYPMIKFLENPMYNEANNISSAVVARSILADAYVIEADLLLRNPELIRKYQYGSNFLAIRKKRTDDWCFSVQNGIITEEKIGGEGDSIWQMVGISYWNGCDGRMLEQDILDVYAAPGGKERYWEQVPLVYRKEHYTVKVRECFDEDIVEIDTFKELKDIDKTYDVG